VICEDCGAETQIGDFPFCHGNPARHGRSSVAVEPDDIPGGEVVQHCPGLHGQTFYSKRAIKDAAAALGWENRVYWTGEHEQHVQRMVAVDLTDYNDPAVIRERQQAMADHCGMTLEAYLHLTSRPLEGRHFLGSMDHELDQAISAAIDRVEAGR
jgi:hypothetical protein